MEQNLYPEQLQTAKARIRAAFNEGQRLTSHEGNRVGHTVDFRKIVSMLRDEGEPIKDYWAQNPEDKRKSKVYYREQAKTPEA